MSKRKKQPKNHSDPGQADVYEDAFLGSGDLAAQKKDTLTARIASRPLMIQTFPLLPLTMPKSSMGST